MAESYKWSEQGWDDSDSCRTSMSEPPQPSHRVGQCKLPIDNARSRFRNNAGNCKRKYKVRRRVKTSRNATSKPNESVIKKANLQNTKNTQKRAYNRAQTKGTPNKLKTDQ